MNTSKPNKRHEALQLFSRDHHNGLVVVRELLTAAKKDPSERQNALSQFVQAWQAEIESHFNEEEDLLLEHMDESDVNRMKTEHQQLRAYADQAIAGGDETLSQEWQQHLAQTLKAHIRWEEQDLFPKLEQAISDEGLNDLYQETSQIEQSRPRSKK